MKYILIILLSLPFFVIGQVEKPSQEMEDLIAQIGGKNIVYGKFVGFAGSTPNEFLAFEEFVHKASLAEMQYYLEHEDASIRAYAFWAISVKHPKVAKKLYQELPADAGKISTMLGGCIMHMETVESFRTQIIKAPIHGLFSSQEKGNQKLAPTSSKY